MFLSFLKTYIADHWRLLLRHWFLLILFAIVLLAILGKVGQSFGVPLLFRDDPAFDYQGFTWWLYRPSLWAYTAATVLLAAILGVVYILEIAGTTPSRSRARTVRETVTFFAIAGAIPLLALLAAAAFPSIPIADGAPDCLAKQEPGSPFTPYNTYCAQGEMQASDADGINWMFHLKEGGKALIGILIGGLIAFLSGLIIFAISEILPKNGRLPGWFTSIWSMRARQEYPLVLGALILIAVLISLAFLLPSRGTSLASLVWPGVAICVLFSVVVMFYFIILLFAPALRFPFVLAFLGFHALVGADRYINELPGFKGNEVVAETGIIEKINYYDEDCLLPLNDEGKPVTGSKREACLGEKETVGAPNEDVAQQEKTPGLLKAKDWVDNWTPKQDESGPRKLVVIATQGGAYRATFWTSLILDELAKRSVEGEMPGLIDHVGLLTGASGGMVASAYFAALSTENKGDGAETAWYETSESDDCGMNAEGSDSWAFGPLTSQICRDIYKASDPENTHSKFTTRWPIARDSLTPVAAQTILYDMRRVLAWPFTFVPGSSALDWDELDYLDRGLVLERQWLKLHPSYGELAKRQQNLMDQGKRFPSMIVSPMIADTGNPLLISNLDLECLVNNGSSEAISLFDWFPDIRDTFKLQTAIRMNASFPYISPAVSLPTTKRRRVVDAGYYDNYGVNTAVSWLFQEEVVDFLAESDLEGLVIIEIRAFQSKDFGQQAQNAKDVIARAKANTQMAQKTRSIGDRSEVEADEQARPQRRKEQHSPDLPLIPEWLTSPLTGVLTARDGSMVYRNNAQIDRLKKVLEARGRSDSFVQSFVFENHAATDQVGVSWHITPQEMATLEAQLTAKHNALQFEALRRFWNQLGPKQGDKIVSGEEAASPAVFSNDNNNIGNAGSACGSRRLTSGDLAMR